MTQPAASLRNLALFTAGLCLAGLAGWWWLHASGPALPTALPPPVGVAAPPGIPPGATDDPITADALDRWRNALTADQWETANAIETEIVARGDAAVPQLEREFTAPAENPAQIIRLQRLAAVLGQINTATAVTALDRLVGQNQQPEVRGQLLLALAKTDRQFEPQVAARLLEALQNRAEPDTTRSSVAILLARRGAKEAIGRLVAWSLTPPPQDPAVADWALTALAYAREADGRPQADAWAALCQTLRADTAADRRRRAAEAIGLSRQPAGATVLFAALADKDVPVRRAAVQALGLLPPDPAIDESLGQVLFTGADPGLRALAAKALGRSGANDNLLRLQTAMTAETPVYVKLKIVAAIEAIGGDKAEAALKTMADSAEPTAVRSAAAAALKQLREPVAPHVPVQPHEPTQPDPAEF